MYIYLYMCACVCVCVCLCICMDVWIDRSMTVYICMTIYICNMSTLLIKLMNVLIIYLISTFVHGFVFKTYTSLSTV